MSGFQLQRLGQLMEPEPGNALEVEGVLNPAAARGRDGQLYIFPRMVAKGNFSRIGIARVLFNEAGDPVGVERKGLALEPETDYECRPDGSGGCEDPRVTYVEPLKRYAMTYTAFSPRGPRIALAVSDDLFKWERLGLTTYTPFEGMAFEGIDDKDSCLFPMSIPNPVDDPSLGILHRPLFPGTRPEEKVEAKSHGLRDLQKESIWISYRPIDVGPEHRERKHFSRHHRLAAPEADWETLKIGVGTPPVMTKHGWMVVYHGVSERPDSTPDHRRLSYSAGVMILDEKDPRMILYRSPHPILSPDRPEEQVGTVGNVVFPTGIDRRDDIGQPDRFDIYYGMADDRIGVARLDVPDELPKEGRKNPAHIYLDRG